MYIAKDDRSHIPPQQRPIFEILFGELQNQRQRSSVNYKKRNIFNFIYILMGFYFIFIL